MPPRPFPLPLRVGTDICSISRIRKILAPAEGSSVPRLERFLPKLLTWPERRHFWNRFGSHKSSPDHATAIAQFIAGRWAAKEACRKACEHLGTSNGFHSILILPVSSYGDYANGATSRPQGLILRERLAERLVHISESTETSRLDDFDINSVDGQLCEISISHDTDWAIATAIVPTFDSWDEK